jgi:hypothetical protein
MPRIDPTALTQRRLFALGECISWADEGRFHYQYRGDCMRHLVRMGLVRMAGRINCRSLTGKVARMPTWAPTEEGRRRYTEAMCK